MGNKSHFFRQSSGAVTNGLVADYNFENNLIDRINGNNGVGTDVSFTNGNTIYLNGISSFVEVASTQANTFTDGVNDQPYRIEISVKIQSTNSTDIYILTKRSSQYSIDWMIFKYGNAIYSRMYSDNGKLMQVGCNYSPNVNNFITIVLEYDGSRNIDGYNIFVNNVKGTIKSNNGFNGVTNNSNSFFIGTQYDKSEYMNGEIDYLKIYKP
tara:strand:+ start:11 stop:643 length:633 start_codon:yes stop_codon:yes gene_type:complete